MAFTDIMNITEAGLGDYSNFPVDLGFMDNNGSSNYDLGFESSQSTMYAAHHSRSSSNNFENGSYHSDSSQFQQQQQQQQQKPTGQFQNGNSHLQDPQLPTARMGCASEDVNWCPPRLPPAANEELEQPNMNSFQLPHPGVNSNCTDLSSWDPQQQRQQALNSMGLQQPSRNVIPTSPAGSAVMGSFSKAFVRMHNQSQQRQEEMRSRSASHSENSPSEASTECGDNIQRGEHPRRTSRSSSLDTSQLSALTTLQHHGVADVPATKNGSMALMGFENNVAAKLAKSSSPQQIPMKRQQPDGDMVHTRTDSCDGSLTAESAMVSSSPSRRGFQSSQLRDLTNPPTPASTPHSAIMQQQQQQQQQQVTQGAGTQPAEDYANQQERGLHLVNLLVGCADAVANNNQATAMSLLNDLSQMVSPHGNSIQRVASYFTYGLLAHIANTASGSTLYRTLRIKEPTAADTLDARQVFAKVCPYMRFGEVAAIQAILRAFQGEEDVHWIDLGMVPGCLWLPCQLLQALASRSGGPPKMIHFTGVQVNVSTAEDQTGRQLKEFADNLHLNFIFQPVPVDRLEDLKPWMLTARPGQAIAVYCSAKLHTLLYDDGSCLNHVLGIIYNLAPKVFCTLEQEATHNVPTFLARFLEALHFYSAIFDSLEATLNRVSPERAKVEQLLLGQEIINIASREGNERVERHERFQHWRSRMAKAGFRQLPLSEATVAHVKSLRCISYGIGFTVVEDRHSLILNWQDRPLFTSAAWSAN